MSIANLQTNRLSLGVDEPLSVSELRILRGTHNIVPTDYCLQDYIAGREIVRRWTAISGSDAMLVDFLRREMRGYLFGSVCGQERIDCQMLADQYIADAVNAGYLRLVRKGRSRR